MTASELFQQQYGAAATIGGYAPGRLEFIGNHVDYNGGLVIGATIDRGVQAAAARRNDRRVRVCSQSYSPAVETGLDLLAPLTGDAAWANYPLGVAWSLQKNGQKFPTGFDLAIAGDLPAGAGLSSSAALELATAVALRELFGLAIAPADLARWSRQAENEFVGMPCGILDQGVSTFGQEGRLVLIDCRAETFTTVPVPASARFWIFNTGAKHALLDSLYAARRRECEAALRILQEGHADAKFLADISSAEVEAARAKLTPELYSRALHVTREIERVRATVAALEQGDLAAVGKWLVASHQSSRELFENSCPELDFLVDRLVKLPGVYGARLTGGGFGGAVMALTTPEFTATVAAPVTAAYAREFGHEPVVFTARTGPGARALQ
ncbi:MAG TPA: galactokinase [Opitutales bacterium]|nr:galactokinase [Opitutales bacterium]